MVDKSKSGNDKGFVHCYVGEIALDNASTTEQIPSSAKSWTPQKRARDNGGLALYRATAVTTLRDQLPNACADFCQPVLRPDGGEASNRRLVEHEEPAEIEPPLSKIITSQGRTRKGMRVRRCGDRSMPGLARRRSRLRGIRANSGRHRAGTGHLSSAQGGRRSRCGSSGTPHPRAQRRSGARRHAEHLHHLAQAPAAGSRAFRPRTASRRGPGNIAESDEICVRN